MPYDQHFAMICAWLQAHGYTAHTFNGYIGAKGPCWTELRTKDTRQFVKRM